MTNEADRQTDRQIDRNRWKETDGKKQMERNRWKETDGKKQMERNRQTDRHTHTHRQTDTW